MINSPNASVPQGTPELIAPESPTTWTSRLKDLTAHACDIACLDIFDAEASKLPREHAGEYWRSFMVARPINNEAYLAWRRLRNEDKLANAQIAAYEAQAKLHNAEAEWTNRGREARINQSVRTYLNEHEKDKLNWEVNLLKAQSANASRGKRI